MAGLTSDESFIREQFRAVVPDLPRLYATVIVVVVFVYLLLRPVAPPTIIGAWAALLIAVAVVRGLHWRRVSRDLEKYSLAEMRNFLGQINGIGIAMIAVFASASFLALLTPDLLLRAVTMLAIWSAAIGTAFYVSVLPRCASTMVRSVTVCLCLVFLWSGGRALSITTLLFVAVSYALSIQLRRSYETFKGAVEANHTIELLRIEAMSLALTDALTGLPNRRAFDQRLAMLAETSQPFALAAIDLDGFKPVNDAFGHAIGDRALVIVAERLRALGARVFVSRFGGDEFVLLIEGAEHAEAIAQDAIDALSKPYEIDGALICMGASCGLAYWRRAGDENELVKRADAALYLAKARPGRKFEHEQGRCVIVKSAA